ncbi:MAG: hypothetical protein N2485_05230 [bacterium]|nr:hypothetical protein [bacterium]
MRIYYLPRASNSLVKILKNLPTIFKDFKNMFILFPANICYTFPLASIYCNFKLSFYDIDYKTLYPFDLKKIIACYPKDSLILINVVIPYGNFEPQKVILLKNEIERINEFIKKDNKLVITLWDMALVIPTKETLEFILNNSKLFKQDFFVFSFSYAKQLELGYGSALFSPFNLNINLSNVIDKSIISKLINKVDKIFKGSNIFYSKNKTEILFKIINNKNVFKCYNSELILIDQNELDNILDKILNNLDFSIILRNNLKTTFFSLLELKKNINYFYLTTLKSILTKKSVLLKDNLIELLDSDLLSWRFNIRINFNRDELLNELFKEGVFVSRLFPVVSHLFLNQNFSYFDSNINDFANSSSHWLKVINIFNNHLVIDSNFLIRELNTTKDYLNSSYINNFVEVIKKFVNYF